MSTWNGFTVVTMPSDPAAPSSLEFQRTALVATSTNPFTGSQTVQTWNAAYYEASVSLQPMPKAQAQAWLTFIDGLNGPLNVFVFPDSVCALYPKELTTNGTTPRHWRLKGSQSHWSVAVGGIYSIVFEIRECV